MKKENSMMKKNKGCRPKNEFKFIFSKMAMFFMCSAGFAPEAFSVCATSSPPVVNGQSFSLEGGIPVSPTASVGAVIYSKTVVFTSNLSTPYIKCTGEEARTRYWFFNNVAYGSYTSEILKTAVPGLGLRIKGPNGKYIKTPFERHPLPSGPLALTYADENSLTLELVKMSSDLGSFKLMAILISNIGYYVTAGGRDYQNWNIYWSGNLTSSAGTCSTSDVNVNLGTHPSSIFTSIGSTSPAKPFIVNVRCTNRTPNVGIKLDPVFPTLDVSRGIFSLDPSSGAKGVGIQIMTMDGTPVNFNLPIKNSVTPDNNFTFPLKAAFIKTGQTVSAGKGKSSAWVTITYQ